MFLDDVAADFPDLTIVMAHPSVPWQDAAISIATHKANVHIDLSGWSPKYFPPQLVRAANSFLKHKVLFGSDFPVVTPDRWMADFTKLEIENDVRPMILKDDAARMLGLEQPPEACRNAAPSGAVHTVLRVTPASPGAGAEPARRFGLLQPFVRCRVRARSPSVTTELTRVEKDVQRITGRTPTLMRPPQGRTDDNVSALMKKLGLAQVLWSVTAKDYATTDTALITRRVLDQTRRDGIILLHERYRGTIPAVPEIIDTLRRRGYTFVTVSRLLAPAMHSPGPYTG